MCAGKLHLHPDVHGTEYTELLQAATENSDGYVSNEGYADHLLATLLFTLKVQR